MRLMYVHALLSIDTSRILHHLPDAPFWPRFGPSGDDFFWMQMMTQFALFTMLALAGGAEIAAEATDTSSSFVPANFVEGARSIENLVEFPDIDGDIEVTVTCAGHATRKGRLKEARCSSPNDPDYKFTLAVSRRFNTARLTPARVNSSPEDVDFQFSVIFSKSGEKREVVVYANNQKNVHRLGLDYISAQRYSPHPFPNRCEGWRRDDLILEVAIVEISGRPRDVDTMSSTAGMPSRCREELLARLKDARWIPALHNGVFVESIWVNPIVLTNISYRREQ